MSASSGYGSMGSSGSQEHHVSIASCSESSGPCVEEAQKQPVGADVLLCGCYIIPLVLCDVSLLVLHLLTSADLFWT
jgi:hypothetical protein